MQLVVVVMSVVKFNVKQTENRLESLRERNGGHVDGGERPGESTTGRGARFHRFPRVLMEITQRGDLQGSGLVQELRDQWKVHPVGRHIK